MWHPPPHISLEHKIMFLNHFLHNYSMCWKKCTKMLKFMRFWYIYIYICSFSPKHSATLHFGYTVDTLSTIAYNAKCYCDGTKCISKVNKYLSPFWLPHKGSILRSTLLFLRDTTYLSPKVQQLQQIQSLYHQHYKYIWFGFSIHGNSKQKWEFNFPDLSKQVMMCIIHLYWYALA